MFDQSVTIFPTPPVPTDNELGLFPVDFLLETVIRAGLDWFRTTPEAKNEVFGHLRNPALTGKYGQAKIDEIAAFIQKYDIRVVQHFTLIDATLPNISIQLLDGGEMIERAGLADFQRSIDVLDAENNVTGRTDVGYSPITDNIQIGIHVNNTPDLAKYLYYLVIYILCAYKPTLEARGLQLGTFRATDISRLNEYLPENMFSRFINFTVFSVATFSKGAAPIIEKIMGVQATSEPLPPSEEGALQTEFGLGLDDTHQSNG